MATDSRHGRIRGTLRRRVGIDARAAAPFRIATGLLVVADIAMRDRQITAFYTGAGVLPRSTLRASFPVLASLSLHTLTGTYWGQGTLFAATAAAALGLVVGNRTRLATAVTGIMVASL